ncbi:MAG TPA: hypothetical protein VJ747_10530 [Stellaceae bacterium]|nr:hypothetical protein [Stellaceae bacterium]
MDKVLFINDVLSVREQIVEGKAPSVVLHIEVETKTGRQVLSLSMDLARQLLAGLEHVLNGTGD